MKFLYPADLLDIIKERWNKLQGPRELLLVAKWEWDLNAGKMVRTKHSKGERTLDPGPLEELPFPSDAALTCLLETVYHASFLTEEARRLAIRVIYLPSDLSDKVKRFVLNDDETDVIRLTPPQFLSPAALLRLTPAVDPTQTFVVVGDSEKLGLDSNTPLAIWGLLHHGTEWWELVTGRATGASCPPHSISVSSFLPGEIVVSAGGTVILRLRDGSLIMPALGNLREGPIGVFLEDAADALYGDACSQLQQREYDEEEDSDDYPRQLYYSTLSNILLRTREKLHGGAFVVIPDELKATDSRLTDRIQIKYLLDELCIWPKLIEEAVNRAKFYELLLPEDYPSRRFKHRSKKLDREALYYAHTFLENVRREIADFESFAATLSGVDGVVILTKRLRIIGFGGEITAISPSLSEIRVASDKEGNVGVSRPITSFGTRHRSAFRFCSSFEDAVGLVVSQDGQVRGTKRVGPDLVMWNDLDLRREVL